MISLENLLNIIATEALEHAGVPEVPDNKHAAPQNYSALKREARSSHLEKDSGRYAADSPPIRYRLELVRQGDGKLTWEE